MPTKGFPHYNGSNPSRGYLGADDEKPSGKRRIMTPDLIRKLAHKSTEGGTATCEKCNTRFSMGYINMVKLTAFRTGFACKDCTKRYHLPVIR